MAQEDESHQQFVSSHEEEQLVEEDVKAFGMMTMLAFVPALAFGGVLSVMMNWPAWTALLLAVPTVLAPQLYALLRIDQSSLPLRIGQLRVVGRARRQWLIIIAIVLVASLVLHVLAPQFTVPAGDW